MILRYFLIEEYRRHASLASSRYLLVFPLYVFIFSLLGGFMVDTVVNEMGYRRAVTTTLLATMVYGFGVSSFEFMGRLRESGQLAKLHKLLPISHRKMYMNLFLRDAIYYSALFVLPSSLGLTLSTIASGVSTLGALYFSASLLLSMLQGYSLGFLSFALATRRRWLYNLSIAIFLAYVVLLSTNVIPFYPSKFRLERI